MQNEFDFRKYLGLLTKHKRLYVIVALAIMTAAVVTGYVLPKKYEAKSIIYIEKNVLNDLLRGFAGGATGSASRDETQQRLNSSIKMMTARSILTKVMNDLDLNVKKQTDAELEDNILSLQKNTNVQLNSNDGLITVSFTHKNPRFARDYVNTLIRRFIEENLSAKREESYGAASFLSEQIASYKEKLDKIESQINKLYREKGAALAVDPASSQPEITGAQSRLDELRMRRAQLEASRAHLRTNTPARSRLIALQRRLAELRVEYTENYPEVVKVKADIEAAQRDMASGSGSSSVSDPGELARVEAELNAVRMGEANQRAIIGNSRGLMMKSPAARAELARLEQEKADTRRIYEQLTARHSQAEVSKQMEVQDKGTTYRIVEPATMPFSPASPNRMMIMLAGIAAGIVGAFALLLAIDYFDDTVKGVDALKTLGIQILAVIPKISDPKATEEEKQKDRRLYLVAGTYFGMIIFLLGLEVIGFSPVDRIIGLISG
ncbi:MAG: XrtA system polysaccharide chain length determinant [Geobacteraceae bacterium]|nr:XrtA system polysaccharide chain length determinant [Geobacteraceae bacterium]